MPNFKKKDKDDTPTQVSRAGPGEGLEVPETLLKVTLNETNEPTRVLIAFVGEEYDPETAWISCPVKNLKKLSV